MDEVSGPHVKLGLEKIIFVVDQKKWYFCKEMVMSLNGLLDKQERVSEKEEKEKGNVMVGLRLKESKNTFRLEKCHKKWKLLT